MAQIGFIISVSAEIAHSHILVLGKDVVFIGCKTILDNSKE